VVQSWRINGLEAELAAEDAPSMPGLRHRLPLNSNTQRAASAMNLAIHRATALLAKRSMRYVGRIEHITSSRREWCVRLS
jgi:hypothetical protein